jgi:dTDP-4-amino-4,6-dideoxygalactose transaminase
VTAARVIERMRVPFLDLGHAHAPIKDELLARIAELIDRGDFTNGDAVAAFEAAFARACGARACIGLASGLDALRLGLVAAGIEPGDEVIVPANTFIATFEAVSQAGGIPVPADVGWTDYNLDPAAAHAAIGPRTRFLLPVHLYGQLADMRTLAAIASVSGMRIVEDACQAHGAVRDRVGPGAHARAAAFSFYPGKNLGAMGDAGALVTDDNGIAETVRALREHGQRVKHDHEHIGWTARLDTIQAIVLQAKLPGLAAANAERVRLAALYDEALAGVGDLGLPPVPAGSRPVRHVYPVRTHDPEGLARRLESAGIATGRHYPRPAHLSPAYAHLGLGPGSFPVAETLARELLSLPLYPGLSDAQLMFVIERIRDHFGAG